MKKTYDWAAEMEKNLNIKNASLPLAKTASALACLDEAAELMETHGMLVAAEVITQVMAKLSKKIG
jgi:hypothetical protein